MAKAFSESISRLTAELARMPGIGERTAERLAYYIVRLTPGQADDLLRAIQDVKRNVKQCSVCCLLSESDPCHICSDERRDRSTICVVEDSRDAATIEATGTFRGLYHVLCGRLAPLEGVEADDLTVDKLLERIKDGRVKEVILATNPDMEGDATALLVKEACAGLRVKLSRLARGLPTGSHLQYANAAVLAEAIEGRREWES
jgi:recombination protein RecR